MTQPPYPQQQPGPGQQWGPPPGQPYPGAPYGPPRPPKQGMGTGAIVAIVLGSIFGLLIVVGIIGAIASSSDPKASEGKGPVKTATAAPAPAKSSEAPAAEEPAEEQPVKLTAKKTKFAPSILHDGGEYTSVTVTITNNSDKQISTNPLNFTITDTDGTKHHAELGTDENQMDLMKLAKGEKATGVITGKGKFTPAYVTYAESWFDEGVRGDVG